MSADDASITIKSGDTLSQRTVQYNREHGTNYTWQEVAEYNNLANPHLIHPGDVITFPSAPVQPAQPAPTVSAPSVPQPQAPKPSVPTPVYSAPAVSTTAAPSPNVVNTSVQVTNNSTEKNKEFYSKQFVLAGIQTFGGLIEIIGGFSTAGISPFVAIYAVLDGIYNMGDGIIGMVEAANGKKWNGMIPTVVSNIANKTVADRKTLEMVSTWSALSDILVDAYFTKSLSLVSDSDKAATTLIRVIESLNSSGSSLSEINTLIEASTASFDFISQ